MGLLERAQGRVSNLESVEAQTRDQVREIIRAYRHSWDVYSELIQNAVDAINRRYLVHNEPNFYLYDWYREQYPDTEANLAFKGRIRLTVDVPNRRIEVCDNGVGIPGQSIESFLLPEGSDKRLGKEYGFKGYGLTYVAFTSEEFSISSCPAFSSTAQAHKLSLYGLFDWVADDVNIGSFPEDPTPDATPIDRDSLGKWNTVVKTKLADNYSERFPAVAAMDQTVKLIENNTRLCGFEYLLRTRTAIGNVLALFGDLPIVPIDVTLCVIYQDGSTVEHDIPYQFFHPKDHEEVEIVAYDFANYVDQLRGASFSPNFRGLYHTVKGEEVGTRPGIKCDFALAAISSTRLSNIEAALHLDDLETGDVDISYGVHLAIDGMPTGLRIDDWDNRGAYLRRYFIVVNADMGLTARFTASEP